MGYTDWSNIIGAQRTIGIEKIRLDLSQKASISDTSLRACVFSTGQREFKASYKLFEREDGNLMGCTVGSWRDIRLSDFGLNLGWQVRSSSNE